MLYLYICSVWAFDFFFWDPYSPISHYIMMNHKLNVLYQSFLANLFYIHSKGSINCLILKYYICLTIIIHIRLVFNRCACRCIKYLQFSCNSGLSFLYTHIFPFKETKKRTSRHKPQVNLDVMAIIWCQKFQIIWDIMDTQRLIRLNCRCI